jgi:tetracycline resistance efflux pump
MDISWTSLLPPIIVLLSACYTHKLNPSLFLGILSATFIASNFKIRQTTLLTFERLSKQIMDSDNLYLYSFLLLVGIIIVLAGKSGGAFAFARSLSKRLKNRTEVELSSMLLSLVLFIDDYLSTLTVGYVMRPLTDAYAIPRVKLAYLVHSLSGPVVILAPISSWVAMITSQLEEAGVMLGHTINADPFFIYLASIPFIFYSFLLFISILLIVHWRISYGPMQEHEDSARQTGNLFGGKAAKIDEIPQHESVHASLLDIVLPLVLLIGSVFFGLAYTGGYYLLGGSATLLKAFQGNTHIFFVLSISGCIAVLFSVLFALYRKTIAWSAVMPTLVEGTQLMFPAVLMVFLASTLGVILRSDLHTGTYLASTLMKAVPLALLPVLIYLASTLIGTVTGSSWGTIALMVPITIEMLLDLLHITGSIELSSIPLLLPILGAIFSGAVCGDHISPISETTIMAATSTGSYPLDHVYTQFFYVLPVIISTALSFVCAGYLIPYGIVSNIFISLAVGGITCMILIFGFNKLLN